MKTEKEYPVKVYVIVQARQKDKNLPGSKSFPVYESSVDEVYEFLKNAIEKS